jgi:hypothetical protein
MRSDADPNVIAGSGERFCTTARRAHSRYRILLGEARQLVEHLRGCLRFSEERNGDEGVTDLAE